MSLCDTVLDDGHWPATSVLIDEAYRMVGNALLVGEGPKDDIGVLFVGIHLRDTVSMPSHTGTGTALRPGVTAPTSAQYERCRHRVPNANGSRRDAPGRR